MKLKIPRILVLALAAWFAAAAVRAYDVAAPGSSARVSVETVEPRPASDELLPTTRLSLFTPSSPQGLVLVDQLPSLCGTAFKWIDATTLYVRVSEAHAPTLRVYDGQVFGGVVIHVIMHDDEVLRRVVSPNGDYSLVVISDCDSEHWNVYLRRRGQGDYNALTGQGWADPDLFGGLIPDFPLLDLEWTGSDSACAVVALHQYGSNFRSKVGPVTMDWEFDSSYRRPPWRGQVMHRVAESPLEQVHDFWRSLKRIRWH